MQTISICRTEEKNKSVRAPIILSDEFIARILSPYKDHTIYLKSAQLKTYYDAGVEGYHPKKTVDLFKIEGRFSIPGSCYINGQEQFNAIEFNFCYNQLASVLFAKCIEMGALQHIVFNWSERVNLSLEKFIRYQLLSMVIVKIQCKFLKPLNSRNFRGNLTVKRIICMGKTAFINTEIIFSDAHGIKSKGSVLLAFKMFNGL